MRRGMVIADLARKSDRSKPYISQVETGKARRSRSLPKRSGSRSRTSFSRTRSDVTSPVGPSAGRFRSGSRTSSCSSFRPRTGASRCSSSRYRRATRRGTHPLARGGGMSLGARGHDHCGPGRPAVRAGARRQLPLGRQLASPDREPRPRGRPAPGCLDASWLLERHLLRGTSRPGGREGRAGAPTARALGAAPSGQAAHRRGEPQ
jgi:hypothetical protein